MAIVLSTMLCDVGQSTLEAFISQMKALEGEGENLIRNVVRICGYLKTRFSELGFYIHKSTGNLYKRLKSYSDSILTHLQRRSRREANKERLVHRDRDFEPARKLVEFIEINDARKFTKCVDESLDRVFRHCSSSRFEKFKEIRINLIGL
jgi:hypothetical protein